MTGPRLTFELLPVSCAAALILTALIAYLLGRRLERWMAMLIAGLALPSAIIGMGIYHASTTAPSEAPRGLILIGALCAAVAVSPITLLVSRLAATHSRR